MRCRGCHEELGTDAWIIRGGAGMVHNTRACHQAAVMHLNEEIERAFDGERARQRRQQQVDQVAVAPPPSVAPQSAGVDPSVLKPSTCVEIPPPSTESRPSAAERNQRVTQMHEGLTEERRAMIRTCLAGRCEHAGTDEPRMTCVGTCGRQLHGVKCAQIAHGHAVLAVFECPECLLRKVTGQGPPHSDGAVKNAEETMILELSRGAEKSGAGFADFVKLEGDWVEFMGGGHVRLPSDCADSLRMFLTYVVRERERSRSLPSLWRVIGSYQVRTFRANLTSDPRVKAHYSSLLDQHGVEEHPRTSATPRMLRLCHTSVVAKHCPKPFICARTKLDIGLEAGCGMRVGEAISGGDFHGLKANHLGILVHRESGLVTVEAMLEHSKTKHRRWANCLGTTVGYAALPLASMVREYWTEAGFKVVSWDEGGYHVTSVDYMVVRVSLLGMTTAQLDLLQRELASSSVSAVRGEVKSTMKRARDRYTAKTSKDKKYINVHGGASADGTLSAMVYELTTAGLGSFTSIVEGPLMRATDGGHVSHMPLDPSSTYGTLHAIMDEAYELANPEGDPDPWLDLQGLDAPLWGHHSWRRLADTLARATMARSGASEQDIDLVFGWQENMYSQRMQYHYETRFNRERRYRVTMFL